MTGSIQNAVEKRTRLGEPGYAKCPSPAPLRLGMFVMPIHDPAKPLAQCLDEDLELAVNKVKDP